MREQILRLESFTHTHKQGKIITKKRHFSIAYENHKTIAFIDSENVKKAVPKACNLVKPVLEENLD